MKYDIIVAGHICLDIILELDSSATDIDSLLVPGKLLEVGFPIMTAAGAVSNTGVALHKLGNKTGLIGKLGDDPYGQEILNFLNSHDDNLTENLVISSNVKSSYTLVLSSPRVDRLFLHHPGANDQFYDQDVPAEILEEARFFHFGYPPLMKQIYENDGKELIKILNRVRDKGLITSLDMALPDPESDAGNINWVKWLIDVLPQVDIFMPSIDEILYMLDRNLYRKLVSENGPENLISAVDAELLNDISNQLITMGAGIVILKLGEKGLYMRTSADSNRFIHMKSGIEQVDDWLNVELMIPCFKTEVQGTTGSGDCTIAGFLSALIMNYNPENALINASAVGAFSVEQVAATEGVPSQDVVYNRVNDNWSQCPINIQLSNWIKNDNQHVLIGPNHKI